MRFLLVVGFICSLITIASGQPIPPGKVIIGGKNGQLTSQAPDILAVRGVLSVHPGGCLQGPLDVIDSTGQQVLHLDAGATFPSGGCK